MDRTAALARIAACQGRIAAASAKVALAAATSRPKLLVEASHQIEEQIAELDALAQVMEDETTTCKRCGWVCSMCRCAEGPKRP
jgi:uncharacterized protein with PIN domain